MFLHQAIQMVLQQYGKKPLTIQEIAAAINQQQLFREKNGSEVTPRQVALGATSDIAESEFPRFDVLVKLRKVEGKFYIDGKPAKLSEIRAEVRAAKLQTKVKKQRKA